MTDYDPAFYGDKIADVFDDWYSAHMPVDEQIDFLSGLIHGGRALELGIGTGRVALPLAARGVDVTGIEASHDMAAKLRAKVGGDRIPIVIGDFADVEVQGNFALVYAAFTTFFALQSQQEQIRCLRNVAARLQPGGWFVIDAFVPDLTRYHAGQAVRLEDVNTAQILMEVARHDPVEQRIETAHVAITEMGIRIYPVFLRYAWPAELDAMALAAGLSLVARFNGYDRRPFTASSKNHVSMYRKPMAAPE